MEFRCALIIIVHFGAIRLEVQHCLSDLYIVILKFQTFYLLPLQAFTVTVTSLRCTVVFPKQVDSRFDGI